MTVSSGAMLCNHPVALRATARYRAVMSTDELQLPNTDDLVIERHIDLDLDAAELWELVASPEGWRRWLVDEAELDVRDGELGRILDGDVERHVRIGAVERGERVSFTWWEEHDPTSVSEVSISIVRREDGAAGLDIVERIPAARLAASARAATTDIADGVRFAWEVRACVLWAGTRSAARV
jgi:uncharacterized protein YndB with AHSA1/START domain